MRGEVGEQPHLRKRVMVEANCWKLFITVEGALLTGKDDSRQTWEEQVGCWTLVPAHLVEGIATYAAENAIAEHCWLISWSSHWEAIWQQARLVLQNHLSSNEEEGKISALEIEIEDKENKALIFDLNDM